MPNSVVSKQVREILVPFRLDLEEAPNCVMLVRGWICAVAVLCVLGCCGVDCHSSESQERKVAWFGLQTPDQCLMYVVVVVRRGERCDDDPFA